MIMAIPADPAAMIPTSSMFTIDEHISTDRIQFLTPQKKFANKADIGYNTVVTKQSNANTEDPAYNNVVTKQSNANGVVIHDTKHVYYTRIYFPLTQSTLVFDASLCFSRASESTSSFPCFLITSWIVMGVCLLTRTDGRQACLFRSL